MHEHNDNHDSIIPQPRVGKEAHAFLRMYQGLSTERKIKFLIYLYLMDNTAQSRDILTILHHTIGQYLQGGVK